MADEYGLPNTEEEFKALIDELLGKVPDKKAQQADARQALSEIIGIDLDKVEKLINGGQIVFSPEEMFDTTEKNEPSEQEVPASVLAEDLFTAQDPNGLQSTYRAIELPFGTVITIEGVEFLHTLIDHGDHGHSAWVNTMTELFDDNAVAELARNANGNVTIIHFG
jgi:hypothetical protein